MRAAPRGAGAILGIARGRRARRSAASARRGGCWFDVLIALRLRDDDLVADGEHAGVHAFALVAGPPSCTTVPLSKVRPHVEFDKRFGIGCILRPPKSVPFRVDAAPVQPDCRLERDDM